MQNFPLRFFGQLPIVFRPADLLDIAIIAVFLYFFLSWLRQRASRSALVAAVLAVALYVAARLLNLYLTLMVFQAGVVILMIALVVVFQEDLRRLFSRIGTFAFFQHAAPPTSEEAISSLTEAVFDLAVKRIGALIVLKGREPLDPHIDGGTDVDGRISRTLLYSIFHPASPGHDGAVLLEDDRIRCLGTHLPLSRNLAEVGEAGTRHAAAIGLTERTDALVIIVSEERGSASIAERGKLEPVKSAVELENRLHQYYRRYHPSAGQGRWSSLITSQLGTKFAALALAMLLWLTFVYRVHTVQRTYVVPVEYRNPPPNWILEDPIPREARVTLSGPEGIFSLFDADSAAVSLDVSHVREGRQQMPVPDNSVNRPPALSVDQVDPRVVTVRAHRLVSVRLPVEVRLEGTPANGRQVAGTTVEPKSVDVLLSSDERENVRHVRTEPVDVQGATKDLSQTVGLVAPPNAKLPEPTPKIRVTVHIAEQAPGKGR